MKKVLVCALAVFFLMASCSTAFAATITTSTAYATNSDEITVTTIVDGAASTDMISFLAYKGETKNKDDLVYADQQTGATTTFRYNAKANEIATTDIQLGTTSATAFDPAIVSLDGEIRNVNVTLNGETKATVILPEEVNGSTTFVVNLTLASNQTFASAKVGDTTLTAEYSNGKLTINDDVSITNNCTIAVTATEAVVERTITGIESARFVAKYASEYIAEGNEVLTVFAKITYNSGDKYGVKIGTSEATAVAYEAKGIGSDGEFAIQLVNEKEEKELTEGTWYAWVYITDAEGTVQKTSGQIDIELLN